ncbi:hypothetical protein [Pseudonocardia xinjiangensis]|uniref:hypothetical protein n=1 Tax=Pseudonocardia xinjiangensis TaxID=75289 RepID=UPI001FECCE95
MAEQAARMGHRHPRADDHDGLYDLVRFAEAAKQVGVRTAFGAELRLDLPGRQNCVPDPTGTHLLVLDRGLAGYRRIQEHDGHSNIRQVCVGELDRVRVSWRVQANRHR